MIWLSKLTEPARLRCSIRQIRYCGTRHQIWLILPSTAFLHCHNYITSQRLGVVVHSARLKALQAWDSRLRTLRVIQVASLIVDILQAICLSLLPYHRYDESSIHQRVLLALYTKLAISHWGLSFGIRISVALKSSMRSIILAHIIHHGLLSELHTLTTMVKNVTTLLLMDRLWMSHGEMPV